MRHLSLPKFAIWAPFLLSLTQLSAVDYYISPSGVDTGQSGSISEPWETFSYAVSQLMAGDVLYLRAGTYEERLILTGLSGAAGDAIKVVNYPGEVAIIDGGSLTLVSSEREGLVVIQNSDYVEVVGLVVRNLKTTMNTRTPVGIQIEGRGTGIVVSECTVTEIWQSSTSRSANGFGISVYGSEIIPIDGLRLENNVIHNLRTGQSESVVLNGNVTNFVVSGNQVYDCNNIGIDFIGYEGSAPAAYDRARWGVCSDNLVYDIDSVDNPGYGGSVGSGGGDQSAAGIYIDGGTGILVERNEVYGCNFGIELASEHSSGFTDYIIMRNNLLHHNLGPGIIMGGYDSDRGTTRFCQVLHNTLFRNDVLLTYGGQVALQFYLEDNVFNHNIIWANPDSKQMIVHYVEGGTATQRSFDAATNLFDYNVYFCEGDSGDIEFGLNLDGLGGSQGNDSYYGLAAWRLAIGSDSNSAFLNPAFSVATPSASPAAADFKLSSASPCRDVGDSAFAPSGNEKNFFGSSRLANVIVDIGCHEYMTTIQAWRDLYFSLPDGGGDADDVGDFDQDQFQNLIEYSQGMNPTVADPAAGPHGEIISGVFRYFYRKAAAELSYEVQTTTQFQAWPETNVAEQQDSNGLYWRDLPLGDSLFVRLQVSE